MEAARSKTWAKAGITIQFMALVRLLGEVFRLRHIRGAGLTLPMVQPFVNGAFLTALLCWLAVGLFFFGRYRAACAVAVLTVIVLIAYKVILMGQAP